MSETRRIRSDGDEIGEEGLRRLGRMIARDELEPPIEFWSLKTNTWQPIAGIMNDFDDRDRVAEMRESGVTACEVIGAGDGTECPACAALLGKRLAIDQAPELPPVGCACIPWCRCLIIAVK